MVALNGRVVYSPPNLLDSPPQGRSGFIAYTEKIEKERRAIAETVLGHYALTQTDICAPAVNRVTDGIYQYWEARTHQLALLAQFLAARQSDRYLYGATSFGRLDKPMGDPAKPFLGVLRRDGTTPIEWAKIDQWFSVMRANAINLPRIMSLHDNFLRIFKQWGPHDMPEQCEMFSRLLGFLRIFKQWGPHDMPDPRGMFYRPLPGELREKLAMLRFGSPPPDRKKRQEYEERLKNEANAARKREEHLKSTVLPNEWEWSRSRTWRRMQSTQARLLPKELFDPRFRGRRDRLGDKTPTTRRPGVLPAVVTLNIDATLARIGLSVADMQLERRIRGVDRFAPDFSSMAPEFAKELRTHRLNFGAGPSGTTGTLLTSAVTFGDLRGKEELKQYLFACVAYLVGGGMHTCHEVFTTGSLLELPYDVGKYHKILPEKFVSSAAYAEWCTEFLDIAPRS